MGFHTGLDSFGGEKLAVQQGHGDHVVELQVFQLPGVDHPSGDQPDGHRRDQIDENREAQRERHHQQMFPLETMNPGEYPPVDDVPSDHDEDTGQDGMGNRLDKPAQPE